MPYFRAFQPLWYRQPYLRIQSLSWWITSISYSDISGAIAGIELQVIPFLFPTGLTMVNNQKMQKNWNQFFCIFLTFLSGFEPLAFRLGETTSPLPAVSLHAFSYHFLSDMSKFVSVLLFHHCAFRAFSSPTTGFCFISRKLASHYF